MAAVKGSIAVTLVQMKVKLCRPFLKCNAVKFTQYILTDLTFIYTSTLTFTVVNVL